MIQALLGRKLGMTRLFDENGVVTASTLVEAGPCFITLLRTAERDGYTASDLVSAMTGAHEPSAHTTSPPSDERAGGEAP